MLWTEMLISVVARIIRFLIEIFSGFAFYLYYKDKSKQLPPICNRLLLQRAEILASKIRKRQLKSKTLVEAFITRIEEVNPILNAVVDERFKEALKEAEEIDKLIESRVKSEHQLQHETPLLGIPFTIKESIEVKGLRQTIGLVSRKDVVGIEDAQVVQLMKKAGAILLAVTNVPELCYWLETHNHVYGRTNNPYNTTRIVGGSSGGEGSIVSACGSVIGIGADIGGSIRLPSFANGIFGHKPTPGIVPLSGQLPLSMEELSDFNTIGPMCKHATDLKLVLKVLAGSNRSKLTLEKNVDVKCLRFFYMKSDEGYLTSRVHPEILKAQEKVVKYFEDVCETKIQEIHLSEMKYAFQIFSKMLETHGVHLVAEEATDRKGAINPVLELCKSFIGSSPFTIHTIYNCLQEKFILPHLSDDYYDSFESLQQKFNDLLRDDGVFLYPTQPMPADYHLRSVLQPFNFVYTGIFNVLGFPSTQCPLGLSKEGLPLGLQVVAGKNNDHLCLAVATELEKAFGGWISPSVIL